MSKGKTYTIQKEKPATGQDKKLTAQGIEQAFRVEIIRESTDSMFRTDEKWLCAFMRSEMPIDVKGIQDLIQAAIGADVDYLLALVFGAVTEDAETELREILAKEKIHVALLANYLSEILAADYGHNEELKNLKHEFSFARLRKQTQQEVESLPWWKHFQTVSIQPTRLLPLHSQDAALAEADLPRAVQQGSLLLLGEPGAGKTTSLLALAESLAGSGGRTPVFLPLGRYQGDFWAVLCEAMSGENNPIPVKTAKALAASGCLVLILDGINEVQNPDLNKQLIDELNNLTSPDEAFVRSLWIVSGRVHDYEQSRFRLSFLESRRWEMQPLTADLIYQFMADALGKDKGLALYNNLGESVRHICANPLLLTMVLAVYQETGKSPGGRGTLYRQFVELLLKWGEDRQLGVSDRKTLEEQLQELLTDERYQSLVTEALTALAISMPATMIRYQDARQQFETVLPQAKEPWRAANLLLDDLTRRGILRRDMYNRIRFFHHTFQEYFQAWELAEYKIEELIPKQGVPASQREAVIFLANLVPDPFPLIRRALEIDLLLAFEILRDIPKGMSSEPARDLAKRLWKHCTKKGGMSGYRRRFAVLFQYISDLQGKKVETLAAEIDNNLSRTKQADNLMIFYAELGDAQAQQRVLTDVTSGEEIPEPLLSRAAKSANDSGDHKRAVELYTRYLEKNPNVAAAYNNRGVSYKALEQKEKALADYQRAVELEESSIQHTNLATLLHDLGRRDEALHHLRLALEKDPTFSTAHSQLANYLESEDPETALSHREQAVLL